MKTAEQKEDTHLWTVTINDGFHAYQYKLLAHNEDVCIQDIANIVQDKLDADCVEVRMDRLK